MRPLTLRRLLLQCLVLIVILFFVVIVALKFGAVPVSLYALGRDLLRVIFGQSSQISTDYGLIILNIRLPRILLGIIVGASLSVAGTSFQALLRNPLADPFVLGVSSGASLGAILALIAEPHLALSPVFSALLTPLGAFLGAAATIAAVYFLGRHEGQIDSSTLLLGGVIITRYSHVKREITGALPCRVGFPKLERRQWLIGPRRTDHLDQRRCPAEQSRLRFRRVISLGIRPHERQVDVNVRIDEPRENIFP